MSDGQRTHPDCRNASTSDHECSEYCFTVIAEAKARMLKFNQILKNMLMMAMPHPLAENEEGDFQNLTGRKEKMAELRKKLIPRIFNTWQTWKADLISAGFNRDDVAPILSIPLSRTGCRDRLVWHHSANGEYSVKSGYGVTVGLMEEGDLGRKGRGSPSEKQKNNQVWHSIWKLKVPNKIKFFMWRCCNNALAVRSILKRRHMRIDNVCGVCSMVDESENHLFFRCGFSHLFWFSSSLHLNSHDLVGVDFLANWENLCSIVKGRETADDILQELAFGLWRLWKNRNEIVFKGVHRTPVEVIEVWRRNISDYRTTTSRGPEDRRNDNHLKTQGEVCGDSQWRKPDYGYIKVNTDAAWCKNTLRLGAGWVCHDFAGLLQAAGGGTGTGLCHSAAAGEACAIRDVILACVNLGFQKVVIESDAKLVIQMIRKEMTTNYSLECILGDIETLARSLTSVTFAFVPRKGNLAAHSVAKYVFKEGRNFVWDCIGPEFLFNTLAKDVNISIRI